MLVVRFEGRHGAIHLQTVQNTILDQLWNDPLNESFPYNTHSWLGCLQLTLALFIDEHFTALFFIRDAAVDFDS